MRLPVLIAAVAAIGGSAQADPLSQSDFQQLMQAAADESYSGWSPQVQTICVQRELEAPLKLIRDSASKGNLFPGSILDKSLTAALSHRARVEQRTTMPPFPSRFVMFSSKAPKPPECVVEHGWATARYTSVTLTFTRPAFADGMAFINEVEDCPGLCGNGILRVFKKQNGKWTQVTKAILWVS
jgi:hypothetical protein